MRGFPIFVAIAVFISIGVRMFRALAEAQENRKSSDGEGEDKGEWTEWKEATRASRPSPPPPPPVARHAGPPPVPVAAQVRTVGARQKLQEIMRDVQTAVKEAQQPAPPPPPPPAAASENQPAAASSSQHEPIEQAAALPLVQSGPAAPHPDNAAFESLYNAPLPDIARADSPSLSAPGMQVELLDRQDLQRAIVLREILERPRAFDL